MSRYSLGQTDTTCRSDQVRTYVEKAEQEAEGVELERGKNDWLVVRRV